MVMTSLFILILALANMSTLTASERVAGIRVNQHLTYPLLGEPP